MLKSLIIGVVTFVLAFALGFLSTTWGIPESMASIVSVSIVGAIISAEICWFNRNNRNS